MTIKDSTQQLLMTIKMKRAVTLAVLASELGISKEGVRQRLAKLTAEGLVLSQHQADGVGRPTAHYHLTEKGLARFPDTHAQITVDLLQSVKKLLGENALDLLISDREKLHYVRYTAALESSKNMEEKLQKLTELRSQEGYMAEWSAEKEGYLFVENHCPICAAAKECQGFCRAELKNFQAILGSNYEVTRTEHILQDGQRCAYSIVPKAE